MFFGVKLEMIDGLRTHGRFHGIYFIEKRTCKKRNRGKKWVVILFQGLYIHTSTCCNPNTYTRTVVQIIIK